VATSDPIAEIIGDYRAFAAMQRDRLVARGIVHVDDENGGAFAREEERRLPPDTAARARDERNLSFESHILSK
jgi:hypothetical protein